MPPLPRLLRALRLRTSVHRYAMRVLDDLGHPVLADPVTRIGPRTVETGVDPLRVLICGGGLAVGYGVHTRAQAIDGPLARLLAAQCSRGVSLENRAVQHIRVREVPDSLGATGTHTFHVAIWCPSFAEGLEHLNLRGWRDDLHLMIRELRQSRTIPIVLAHMPSPLGLHPAAVLARPWVSRLNQVIDQVAAAHDRISSCAVEPFTAREVGQPVTDAAYFAAVAAQLTEAVQAVLQPPRTPGVAWHEAPASSAAQRGVREAHPAAAEMRRFGAELKRDGPADRAPPPPRERSADDVQSPYRGSVTPDV